MEALTFSSKDRTSGEVQEFSLEKEVPEGTFVVSIVVECPQEFHRSREDLNLVYVKTNFAERKGRKYLTGFLPECHGEGIRHVRDGVEVVLRREGTPTLSLVDERDLPVLPSGDWSLTLSTSPEGTKGSSSDYEERAVELAYEAGHKVRERAKAYVAKTKNDALEGVEIFGERLEEFLGGFESRLHRDSASSHPSILEKVQRVSKEPKDQAHWKRTRCGVGAFEDYLKDALELFVEDSLRDFGEVNEEEMEEDVRKLFG